MSFGGPEGTYSASYDTTYLAGSTKSFFASTGDSGSAGKNKEYDWNIHINNKHTSSNTHNFIGGISYPSSSKYVVAVGGTSIYSNPDHTFSSEQGWTGSGGGCSAYTSAIPSQTSTAGYASLSPSLHLVLLSNPSSQKLIVSFSTIRRYSCAGKKALPDISMLGDPNSGLIIYLTQATGGKPACTTNCYFIVGMSFFPSLPSSSSFSSSFFTFLFTIKLRRNELGGTIGSGTRSYKRSTDLTWLRVYIFHCL